MRPTTFILLVSNICSATASCIDDPTAPACRTYTYKNASNDLKSACGGMMASMSGCSVRTQCQVGGAGGAACSPFSLLLLACSEMPMMSACDTAHKLCAAGSVVRECTEEPPLLLKIPTSSNARSGVRGACAQMPKMPGCDMCTDTACADPLLALSRVCAAMPAMAQCTGWLAWCEQPDGASELPAFCANVPPAGSKAVPMKMYFHTGWRDYILFQQWVPDDLRTYVAALVCVAVGGIFSSFLRASRVVFEAKGLANRPSNDRGALLRANGVRALFATASSTVDYMLMLVAMTYNVGLFVAVVVGLGIGTVIFGHWGRRRSNNALSTAPDREAPFLTNADNVLDCCH